MEGSNPSWVLLEFSRFNISYKGQHIYHVNHPFKRNDIVLIKIEKLLSVPGPITLCIHYIDMNILSQRAGEFSLLN